MSPVSRIFPLTVAIALLAAACSKEPQGATSTRTEAAASFTCPMHPEVVQATPGRCPTCGMNLVPKSSGSTEKSHEHAASGAH